MLTTDSKIEEYISGHIDREPDNLHRVYRRVNTELLYSRMCSGHIQGRLLKMLTRMIRPHLVLELGTYAGYSALCIAEGLDSDNDRVDTIELEDELEDFIMRSLDESEYGKRVRLHIGDALELLPGLLRENSYDMVYIDANKRHYVEYYELLIDSLRSGAFILADNTLWDGKVADECRHNDAQTRGIMAFNDLVAADDRVEKVILPLRDGLTLIYKK
ncbi:MAG: O-methyltransferase [Muribaculaceae bacterium]|nr:O-methyltransferase [Muribaculaceae bacterium]